MIVDDRLETVLRTRAGSALAARVRYRQLLDILGRTPEDEWDTGHLEALTRIDGLAEAIPADERAAMVRAAVLRTPLLVSHLAGGEPPVAAAAIATARLSDAEWAQLIPELPLAARGFLRHRRDLGPAAQRMLARFGIGDLALPLPPGFEPAVEPRTATGAGAPGAAGDTAGEGIAAIVRRIEAFRRRREAQAAAVAAPDRTTDPTDDPRLPFPGEAEPPSPAAAMIALRADAEGFVEWASPAVAPALVGAQLFAHGPTATLRCDPASLAAARARRTIAGGTIVIEGAAIIAGSWRFDAAPRFARGGGFVGWRGALRRIAEPASAPPAGDDRLRTLLHELRTPINAIQGFAELIQQQLFGPTPHHYRSLAASIAADAARMLGGIEEVERLVRLEAGQEELDTGTTDAGAVLARLAAQIPAAGARETAFSLTVPDQPVAAALAPLEFERLAWRLLSVIARAAGPGEHLPVIIDHRKRDLVIDLRLPEAFDGAQQAEGSDEGFAPAMLGAGFALRLAAAEARAAGGDLTRAGPLLRLRLPLANAPDLTAPGGHHTQSSTRPAV